VYSRFGSHRQPSCVFPAIYLASKLFHDLGLVIVRRLENGLRAERRRGTRDSWRAADSFDGVSQNAGTQPPLESSLAAVSQIEKRLLGWNRSANGADEFRICRPSQPRGQASGKVRLHARISSAVRIPKEQFAFLGTLSGRADRPLIGTDHYGIAPSEGSFEDFCAVHCGTLTRSMADLSGERHATPALRARRTPFPAAMAPEREDLGCGVSSAVAENR